MAVDISQFGFAPLHAITIIEMPIPKMRVQAKRHHRKSSRRWQKKYLKRFGTVEVDAITAEAQMQVYVIGNKLYAYPPAMALIRERFVDVTRRDTEQVEQRIGAIIMPSTEDINRYG